ncbi:hypothetical protein H0H92_000381, partial [Tricholoma furcatifolium]
MPVRWTTPDQFKFLKERIPDYLEYKAKKQSSHSTKDLTRFVEKTIKEFRRKWPEVEAQVATKKLPESALTTDKNMWPQSDRDILEEANREREEQIFSWFRNNSKSAAGLQGSRRQGMKSLAIIAQATKRSRVNKPSEKYGKMRYLDVGEEEDANADLPVDGGACDDGQEEFQLEGKKEATKLFKAWAFTTRNKICAEAYADETLDVKQKVLDVIAKDREEMKMIAESEKEGLARDPAERARVSFGETKETKESFVEFHENFRKDVHEPFVNWLCAINPKLEYAPTTSDGAPLVNPEEVPSATQSEVALSKPAGDKPDVLEELPEASELSLDCGTSNPVDSDTRGSNAMTEEDLSMIDPVLRPIEGTSTPNITPAAPLVTVEAPAQATTGDAFVFPDVLEFLTTEASPLEIPQPVALPTITPITPIAPTVTPPATIVDSEFTEDPASPEDGIAQDTQRGRGRG